MGSTTDQGPFREHIRQVWIKNRVPAQDHIISVFKCKYFDQVDGSEELPPQQREWKTHGRISSYFGPQRIEDEEIEVIFPDEDSHQTSDDQSHDTPLDRFRTYLFQCTDRSSNHGDDYGFEQLDIAFSRLTTIQFSSPASAKEEEIVLDHVLGLISRLPTIPSELPDPPRAPKPNANMRRWGDLKVVSTHSTQVICMALAIAIAWDRNVDLDSETEELHEFRKFLDSTAELLDSVILEGKAAAQANNESDIWRLFVLKSYLWSTWQRCTALHYW